MDIKQKWLNAHYIKPYKHYMVLVTTGEVVGMNGLNGYTLWLYDENELSKMVNESIK